MYMTYYIFRSPAKICCTYSKSEILKVTKSCINGIRFKIYLQTIKKYKKKTIKWERKSSNSFWYLSQASGGLPIRALGRCNPKDLKKENQFKHPFNYNYISN